jgi:hypothetical protein
MAEEVLARGEQLSVNGLGDEVHIPGGNCQSYENALGGESVDISGGVGVGEILPL